MDLTREASTASSVVEGPTPDWWPPAEPVAPRTLVVAKKPQPLRKNEAEHAELVAKLSKNDKTAAQSHMTESTLIFDQGFILANSFVDILFTLVAVTVVMKVCKYLTPEPAWWMFV